MFYVDKDGVLFNSGKDIKFKYTFLTQQHNMGYFDLAMMFNVVFNFSYIAQFMNKMLELSYEVNIERISRTEKNKHRSYSNSSYTVTAGITQRGGNSSQVVTDYLEDIPRYLLTLRGSTINLLTNLLNGDLADRTYFISYCGPFSRESQDDVKYLERDKGLNQIVTQERGNEIIFNFLPIRIVGMKDAIFTMDAVDQSIYLGYITKYMEMMGNYMNNVEYWDFVYRYEIWLISTFKKYIKYEMVELPDERV